MDKEQMKEEIKPKFFRKKWGIIGGIVVVLVVIIVGISIYNTPANRLARQLDLGNRYLEEQNYEQAIVEFDKAIAIYPMSVDAYLGKADAFIGMDDLPSALQTIQTGYDLTGDEKLKEKLDELRAKLDKSEYVEETVLPIEEVQEEQGVAELPFSVSDIKIMGYDFFEPHFDDLVAVFGITLEPGNPSGMIGRANNPYGINVGNLPKSAYDESWIEASSSNESEQGYISIHTEYGKWTNDYAGYNLLHYSYFDSMATMMYVDDAMNRTDIEKICDLPIYPEDTYDEWCEKMGVGIIKNSAEMQSDEGNQSWNSVTDSQNNLSEDGWYVSSYQEGIITDDFSAWDPNCDTYCYIDLMNEAGNAFSIQAEFKDEILCFVYFAFFYDMSRNAE